MLETYLRWFLALLFVAPLAYWGSRLYLKLQHPWMPGGGARANIGSRRRLEVLDAVSLGTGRMLWLIRADQALFLIGSGEKDVRLIASLTPSLLDSEDGKQERKAENEERGEGWARQLPG